VVGEAAAAEEVREVVVMGSGVARMVVVEVERVTSVAVRMAAVAMGVEEEVMGMANLEMGEVARAVVEKETQARLVVQMAAIQVVMAAMAEVVVVDCRAQNRLQIESFGLHPLQCQSSPHGKWHQ